MSRGGRPLALALAAVGALAPSPTFAQGVVGVPLRPGDRAFLAAHGVLSASPNDAEVSTLHAAPQLSAGLRVGGSLYMTADVPAAWTSFRVTGEERRSSFRMGNPFLALHAALVERPEQHLRAGLGLGAPLATFPGTIPANTAAEYGYLVATSARGFAEHWLWAPNAIPLVLLVHGRAELSIPLVFGAEIAPALLVSVNSNPSRVALAAAAYAGYRLGPLTPGVKLQSFVISEPLAAGDFSQWAAAVYLDADLGAAFVRSLVLMNLDAPFGIAGQRGATVWGGSLAGGLRL